MKGAAESGGDSAYIGRLVNVSLPIMVRTCMHWACDCHEDNHWLLGVVPSNCYRLESVPTLSLLGIKFSPSIQETMSRLWNTAYGHLIGQLRENASRQFTIYQKVNYLKTKVLSRTIYIAQILFFPANLCPKILSAIVRFIWLGKI
jgi:hypothetical protein